MIAVECYADTRLVLLLGVPKAKVSHARGKGHVLDALRTGRATLGLVDEDPGSSDYPEMRNYREIARCGGVRLLAHTNPEGPRVIMLSPRLEDWILGRAQVAGINPASFGLAADARRLHDSGRYDRHPRFPRFVEELLAADVELQRLRDWIR